MMAICHACHEFRLLVEMKAPDGTVVLTCRDCFADEHAEATHD